MMKYKNLYVNGCSFTKGHTVLGEKCWPNLTSNHLKLDLFNESKNGNSLKSIVLSTILHLKNFSSKETLVIIGITWPDRKSVPFNEYLFNITPSDLSKFKLDKITFEDKIHPDGRANLPYKKFDSFKNYLIEKKEKNIENSLNIISSRQKEIDLLLGKYLDYYKTYSILDDNFIRNNMIESLFLIECLQNYLVVNNFDYIFIDFGQITTHSNDFNFLNLFNLKEIINVSTSDFDIDKKTSHPSELGHYTLKNIILKKYQELY